MEEVTDYRDRWVAVVKGDEDSKVVASATTLEEIEEMVAWVPGDQNFVFFHFDKEGENDAGRS